jgi:CHASE3 domain sensor protein
MVAVIKRTYYLNEDLVSYENTTQFIQRDAVEYRIRTAGSDVTIDDRIRTAGSDVTDAETAQCGYIITDASNYLQPYNPAVKHSWLTWSSQVDRGSRATI